MPLDTPPLPASAAPPHEQAALPAVEYVLAGALGAQLSQPLSSMEDILHELLSSGRISRPQVQSLLASLGVARGVARQSQQLARLAQGPLRQSHEQIDLDEVVRQALQDRSALFLARDVEVLPRLRPVEVVLDPGLLAGLLDAAFAWATAQGTRMVVSLEVRDEPQRALLQFKVLPRDAGSGTANADPAGALSWHLLAALAQAMGVAVNHQRSAAQLLLGLEFDRTVAQLQSLGLGDAETMTDSIISHPYAESRSFAAMRVLLATADAQLRADAEQICRSFSLPVEHADSPEAALRRCSTSDGPRLVILDARLQNGIAADAWRARLHAARPGLVVIDIVEDAPALAMPGWLGEPVVRVGLHALAAELPQVLAQELSKLL
ncbi:hypothetical protein [Xylophilus sp.]|uniref:hypothetical protein n=1 Tax=Xylophilus sp. TaxID=2653893 RepID=UPI0013BE4B64|nr:hypothetical protein [Xylophilus sp.]KAF1044853.1 MAG: hypothetical protein GAK38_03325 [Xylophilus sp.]